MESMWQAATLQVVARALADEESGALEFVGALMDVTRRKRADEAQRTQEREREEMQRRLQQAAKMEAIGRLAGGIAHDFNNILGAIIGYGELALDNVSEDSAVRRHVDQVIHAGVGGKRLVDNILAFSRSGIGERPCVGAWHRRGLRRCDRRDDPDRLGHHIHDLAACFR